MEVNWKSDLQSFPLCNSNALNGLLCMTFEVTANPACKNYYKCGSGKHFEVDWCN